MVRELNVTMKIRPKLEELHVHDILHVGTEEKGDIFHVLKVDETNYLMQREGSSPSEYHKAVLNHNISQFAEMNNAVYTITEYNDDDEDEDECECDDECDDECNCNCDCEDDDS